MKRHTARLFLLSLLAFPCACASVSGVSEDSGTEQSTWLSPNETQTPSDSTIETESPSESASESDSQSSSDPGCEATMSEAFEGGAVPTGWLVEDGANDGYTWAWKIEGNDIGGQASGGYLMVDSASVPGAILRERLVTLERSYHGCTQLNLSFDQSFPKGQDDLASVEISINGGDWQALQQYNAAVSGSQDLDLSSVLASDATFRLSFYYEGSNGQFWKLDNVRVYVPIE